MPTDASVIGFTNRWYADGFKNAISIKLDDCLIKIFSLPYFIASKIEAFKSRGKNNYLYSTDFEDIVYVLENNSNIITLVNDSPIDVKNYLIKSFSEFRQDYLFEEGLSAHLEPNTKEQQILRIKAIVKEFLGDF